MPKSPTGYTSFADYMGLAGDEVKRLQEKQFEDSNQRGQYAQEQLELAARQARATGEADIRKTSSYGNYITASREAARRRAAASMNYDANADSRLERATRKDPRLVAYENDFKERGYAAGQKSKEYASLQQQQRDRDAAYNKRYAESQATEQAGRDSQDAQVNSQRDYLREQERFRRAGFDPVGAEGRNRLPGFVSGDETELDPYNALELEGKKTDENERKNEEYRRQRDGY